MCTSQTESVSLEAHGRGIPEWTRLSSAVVYYDHPVRATSDHAVVLDFRNEDGPLSSRLVVELTAQSAARLARAIDRVLETDPARRELVAASVEG